MWHWQERPQCHLQMRILQTHAGERLVPTPTWSWLIPGLELGSIRPHSQPNASVSLLAPKCDHCTHVCYSINFLQVELEVKLRSA